MSLLLVLLASGAARAADLPDEFASAAAEFDVPEKLLLALSYEASHWQPDAASAWGGYGLFDFREDDSGPNVEEAAILLGISPDEIIADPAQNIRGAAALLAEHASHMEERPASHDLLAWWDAVKAFSGRHEPNLQDMYASYVYELVNFGVTDGELRLRPEPVDHWSLLPIDPPMPGCDYSGCAAFTAASTSNYSNYSRGASDISYVIIHTVQGSYSGCISWFQNPSASVSAHYVVRSSDGAVTQMVYEEDVAWHAGNWSYNLASVGIEHEGYVEDPDTWYTDAMYAGSALLTADIASRNSISVDRSHIIGHVEVPGATHTDPGDGWDWDYYMDLISGGEVTGDLIGVVADSDIYTGTRLSGATVWIAETGESTTSDSDGYYRFYDLTLDSYTVHATASGYDEGTCTKDISTGTNWCSVALTPSSGGGDEGGGTEGGGTEGGGTEGGGTEGGGTEGDGTTDSGNWGGTEHDPGANDDDGSPGTPGDRVEIDKTGSAGCATGGGAVTGLGWLGLLLVGLRRRGR